jgi:hypothetical protein
MSTVTTLQRHQGGSVFSGAVLCGIDLENIVVLLEFDAMPIPKPRGTAVRCQRSTDAATPSPAVVTEKSSPYAAANMCATWCMLHRFQLLKLFIF